MQLNKQILIGYLILNLIVILFLSFPHFNAYLSNLNLNKQIENGHSKIVVIRADDFYEITPGWEWLTDLTKSKDFGATYAAIPYWLNQTTVTALKQLMDENKIEIATHGFKKLAGLSYQDQYNIINQSTNILTKDFYRPRTFVPPNGADDQNTLDACNALEYHVVSGDYVSGVQSITEFVPDFEWESNWTDPKNVPHVSFSNFKFAFDKFDKSSAKAFIIVLHPNEYEDKNGTLKTGEANAFEQSIDYMKGKNVEFMTMDQLYRWNK